MTKLTVRIKRYDPERDDAPHWESYRVEADPTDRILDVLLKIKEDQGETLALRFSRAHGVCGSERYAPDRRHRRCKRRITEE